MDRNITEMATRMASCCTQAEWQVLVLGTVAIKQLCVTSWHCRYQAALCVAYLELLLLNGDLELLLLNGILELSLLVNGDYDEAGDGIIISTVSFLSGFKHLFGGLETNRNGDLSSM
jgi:hypothetical protein